jgi:HEAT repeat protein
MKHSLALGLILLLIASAPADAGDEPVVIGETLGESNKVIQGKSPLKTDQQAAAEGESPVPGPESATQARKAWLLKLLAIPSEKEVREIVLRASGREMLCTDREQRAFFQSWWAIRTTRVSRAAVPLLMEAFKDPRLSTGGLGDSLLEEIGPDAEAAVPELIELLLRFWKDPDSREKLTADPASVCGILGAIGAEAKPAVPLLTRYMEKDRDESVRTAAALALVKIGADSPGLEQVLTKLLGKRDSKDCCEAIRTVYAPGHIGTRSPALRRILGARLDDKDPEVRLAAARSLWMLNHDSKLVVSTLVDVFSQPLDSFQVRAEALRCLGDMGHGASAAIPLIRRKLVRGSEEDLRVLAMVALLRIEGPSADLDHQLTIALERSPIFVLHRVVPGRLLRSNDPLKQVTLRAIRHMADDANGRLDGRFMFETIWRLGSDAAPLVPFLRETLEDRHPLRRQMAARALGTIGPSAKPALVALARLARLDDDFCVRLQASDAVEKILR